MPAWWRRKSKLKPKSAASTPSSTPREPPELGDEIPTPRNHGGAARKEKANSFDAAGYGSGNASGSAGVGPGCGDHFAFGHPLPRPTLSSPLPDHVVAGTGSGSGSASSVSSSGSSEETPDLGFCRYPEPINLQRCRNVTVDAQKQQHTVEDRHVVLSNPVSPRKEFQLYSSSDAFSQRRVPSENMFNLKTTSSAPASRGHPLPTSPRAFGMCPGSPTRRQDDLRSPPHPLPLPPSSPSSSSSSRSVQSQWKKGKLLGRGTFGHVYLGFNSESGQMCAVKEVKVISDDSNSKECLKQLNQEIVLLSQLSHPNIVQYYGSELADETLSVYLEYVSGGSIYKLLQEYGPFKEPVIRSYTGQILSGLAYLHGRNTVHRDIKGANILVDPNGEVKLADFGMAKHISAYTSIRSFKGSPYWMAPEVIMNGSGYNLSVDIWSLGCTILEMATSKPPWSQFEGVAAIFKIGNSKDIPEIPDHISSEGKDFLKQCLQRDPSARPTAAQLMDHTFVRDQAIIKATRSNMFRDMFPSSDGSRIMAPAEYSSTRSVSPLRDRDYGIRHLAGFTTPHKNQSDVLSMRMNMSLPVSPCSSPLRQFKQSNRSCLPSPSHPAAHPAYSAGAINYGPSNYSLYPVRQGNTFPDQWPDISQWNSHTPYGSPRR